MTIYSRRRSTRLAAVAAAAIMSVTGAGAASAQSQLPAPARGAVTGSVMGAHAGMTGSLNLLPGGIADPAKRALDDWVRATVPGSLPTPDVGVTLPNNPPAQNTARPSQCPAAAKACVDINGRKTWLQDGGVTFYGAVPMGPGRPGYETPRGWFTVNRKVKDEISYEFGNAPMPYAVYFTHNGIAFHQGNPDIMSHGCIRLNRDAAITYFNNLHIGDKVFVF